MTEEKIVLQGTKRELMQLIPQMAATRELIASKDIGTVYAYSDEADTVKRQGKPKVHLYFLEDTNFTPTGTSNGIPEGRRRRDGLIRFRLMDESTNTFSQANATAMARKIKEIFGSNGGFVWSKGKTMYSYSDWGMGYQFQLLCRTETEAKRIVTSVLSIQSHIPIWKYFNTVKNDQEDSKYPENPGNQVVMGETVPIPQERPLVDVKFQYSYVKLDGVKEPINLYDRLHKRVKPLVM